MTTRAAVCAFFLACSPSAVPLGGACHFSSQCRAGTFCFKNVCAREPATGSGVEPISITNVTGDSATTDGRAPGAPNGFWMTGGVIINGGGFDSDPALLAVSLTDSAGSVYALTVTQASASTLHASFPASLTTLAIGQGTLTVIGSAGTAQTAVSVLQGPPGPPGTSGAAGPTGNNGLDALAPAGVVVAFAGPTPPNGWLLCDGSAVGRTTYAPLFAAIGTAHGNGDGATTFNLPDYRGRFLRGVDHGTGNDPDAAGRVAMAPGGNTGATLGSLQSDRFKLHSHMLTDPGHSHQESSGYGEVFASELSCCYGGLGDWNSPSSTLASFTGITITATGATETRPVNAAVNWIIKY